MSAVRFPLTTRLRAAWKLLLAAVEWLTATVDYSDALEPLTPILLDPAASEGYERELAVALTNPLVRNVAITGGYGAGKSSLIRTFKEHHPGLTYASVSLATFRKDRVVASTADESDHASAEEPKVNVAELIERIEETIVQQLLYAVPAKKLPRSRLKRIVQASRGRAAFATLLILLGAVAASRLYLPFAHPSKDVQPDWLMSALAWVPATSALLVALAVATALIYAIARSLSLLNIDGWSIKGGKVETVHHGSVLHKNVDEILYCFQNSSIDVVIVEDLDRFGVQDVFFRLREINAIINEAPQITRPVRFVYALNDELFAGSEKTKFFDVVVPVVPVINKENSHAKMIELLRKRKFGGETYASKLNAELVETVCYRIDDMRLVKNIVNEFHIFARIMLKTIRLDWDKLFAMIVIKNVHSDQYWGLSKRQGFVYELVAGYAEWRSKQVAVVRAEMAVLENRLTKKNEDVARSILELRIIAWYHLQSRANTTTAATLIQKEGSNFSLPDFLTDAVFDSFAESTAAQYLLHQNGARISQALRLSDTLQEMDYSARLAAISIDDEATRADLTSKARYCDDLQRMPLAQGMRSGYQESYAERLASYETIKYLLVAGHLDQDYPDYIGHFYGHTIGREDMNLLLALRQGDECDVDTPIEEPARLLKKLRLENIDQGRGIMTDLIGYLCQSYVSDVQGAYSPYLQRVLHDGGEYIDRFAQVVNRLIARGDGHSLARAMFDLKSTLFAAVLNGASFPDQAAEQAFITTTLDTLSLNEVRRLGEDGGSIRNAVEALTDVSLLVPKLTRPAGGWLWIKAATIRFYNLGPATNKDVLASLIASNSLSPSLKMLRLIASKAEVSFDDAYSIALRDVLVTGIDGVDNFVKRHAEDIVRTLLSQPGDLVEDSASALLALHMIESNVDLSVAYFDRTKCTFASLEQLPVRLWLAAIQSDRITDRPDALRRLEAVMEASESSDQVDIDQVDIRAVLSAYAAMHVNDLFKSLWRHDVSDRRLQSWILTEANLADGVAAKLLSTTLIEDPSLLTEEVTDSRLQTLAALECLVLSPELWAVVLDRSPSVQVNYLSPHWDKVRHSQIEDSIPFDTIERLYVGGIVDVEDAVRILSNVDETVIAASPTAPVVFARLARDASVARVSFPKVLSRSVSRLMSSDTLSPDELRYLLTQGIPEMTWGEIAAVLQRIGGGLAQLHPGRTFVVALEPGVAEILVALDKRGYLSSSPELEEGHARGRMRRKVI
ncbi:hypothetical protein IM816_00765 [Luteibacter flocculans]|uniref:YobI-like P-loop NTPase domain-containing protein n=1 Tax=Luteibacter flocculans TaxID=2780091 RepID=A0ABY4T184_9GAMM|nr:hypothetical protein [Luteibacter flocculans]URL58703.1 hypothetical protein IM816_00765 [Luteibacter flocculans]